MQDARALKAEQMREISLPICRAQESKSGKTGVCRPEWQS